MREMRSENKGSSDYFSPFFMGTFWEFLLKPSRGRIWLISQGLVS